LGKRAFQVVVLRGQQICGFLELIGIEAEITGQDLIREVRVYALVLFEKQICQEFQFLGFEVELHGRLLSGADFPSELLTALKHDGGGQVCDSEFVQMDDAAWNLLEV
jgi:hypothetical protein